MKQIVLTFIVAAGLLSCTDDRLQTYDIAQRPAEINIKGYTKPDSLQMVLNGKPVVINNKTTFGGTITTQLKFVLDEGETNDLLITRKADGNQVAKFSFNYNNIEEFETLNFFNLPGIFLQTSATKPTVNLGRIGYEFIFANLGEFSGSSLPDVKGVLTRENGVVLATFENIGKKEFSELKIYNNFGTTAPVFLTLYKTGTTEPYTGSTPIVVKLKQVYINNDRVNMVVIQEKMENGKIVIKGDIDVADFL